MSFFNVGTFAVGYTLTNSRQTLTYAGGEYSWSGAFPKIVVAGSSPTPLGSGGWIDRSDASLRSELRITSYNVCYTKLLRIHPPEPSGVGELPATTILGNAPDQLYSPPA